MAHDLKHEFWTRIGKVQAGMLDAGGGRAVPMSPYAEEDENAIWFITAHGTDVADAAKGGKDASFQVADHSANLYAKVSGSIRAVDDPEKLDKLWNAVAASWFEDGKADPDICLVRMQPRQAEVWATTGTAGFLYEIAKSAMTDQKPDMGEHGMVTF